MEQDNAMVSTDGKIALAERLAEVTQALADALGNLNGQFASIHAKIDRIVAAVDDGELQAAATGAGAGHAAVEASAALQSKVAELEKANHELKAQAATAKRKTLSPIVTALLAKEGFDGDALVETPVVERALAGLSIEQRIAVKAELARAGVLV